MRIKTPIEKEYFTWLLDLVNGRRNRALVEYLHGVRFYSVLKLDENRAADGQSLRDDFEYSTNISVEEIEDEECSVLEMLIALAKRISDIAYEDGSSEITKWFWILIRNLKLHENHNTRNARIIERLLERNYMPSGFGGLFPLNNPSEDQRGTEIWYQMHNYIRENDI